MQCPYLRHPHGRAGECVAALHPRCTSLLTLGSGFRFRTVLRRIAQFCSKNFADRRSDREKFSEMQFFSVHALLACAWICLLSRFDPAWLFRTSKTPLGFRDWLTHIGLSIILTIKRELRRKGMSNCDGQDRSRQSHRLLLTDPIT